MIAGKLRRLGLLLLLGLAACAAAEQSHSLSVQPALVQAQQQCQKIWREPALNPIREKVPVASITNMKPEMQLNDATPTAEEKRVIALWQNARERCLLHLKPVWLLMPTEQRDLLEAQENVVDLLIAELYLGRQTYGSFVSAYTRSYYEMKWVDRTWISAQSNKTEDAIAHAKRLNSQIVAGWATLSRPDAAGEMKRQVAEQPL